MGFQIEMLYQPGFATMQIYRARMAFLKASHKVYSTQNTAVCIIADDK
jgi:hypothetical protein